MNERYINPKAPEHLPAREIHTQGSERPERSRISDEALHQSHEQQLKNLESARKEASHEAQSAHHIEESLGNAVESPQSPQKPIINRELQNMALDRQLIRIRRHLSPYGRAVSRIIHQPVIDTVSETSGKTIARPSGILGGGMVAFLGTLAYYYVTRHYGYSYNAFIFLLLLFFGFVAGWAIEMLWNIVKIGHSKK